MPPYPSCRQRANALVARKNDLLSQMIFMEKSLAGWDFRNFAKLVRAKDELHRINQQLEESEVMRNYAQKIKI